MDCDYYEQYLTEKIDKFFKNDSHFEKLKIVKTKRFLRIIYHGLMSCKRDNIRLYAIHSNISSSYDKRYYDIYSRGERIYYDLDKRAIVYKKGTNTLVTTLGQLNLIKELLIKQNALDYFIKNEDKFRKQLARNEVYFDERFIQFIPLFE